MLETAVLFAVPQRTTEPATFYSKTFTAFPIHTDCKIFKNQIPGKF